MLNYEFLYPKYHNFSFLLLERNDMQDDDSEEIIVTKRKDSYKERHQNVRVKLTSLDGRVARKYM